jgi:hypothetical protein
MSKSITCIEFCDREFEVGVSVRIRASSNVAYIQISILGDDEINICTDADKIKLIANHIFELIANSHLGEDNRMVNFYDHNHESDAFAVIRICDDSVALCFSVMKNGDIEIFMDRSIAKRIASAIYEVISSSVV